MTPREEALVQQQRDEAARRLLSRHLPVANQYLLSALAAPASPREVKLAVVRALADDSSLDPGYINSLLPLVGAERMLSDSAAKALSHLGTTYPAVRQRLTVFATSTSQPAALRLGVIRALGAIVSRDVADVLVNLLGDAREAAAIHDAAADALAELSGQKGRHDTAWWSQWQARGALVPEIVWRADVLAVRGTAENQAAQAGSDFANELRQILTEQYQQATGEPRLAIVNRLLNSADPRTRELGIQWVIDAHEAASPFPAQAPRRLQELVGDSDAGVRLAVTRAIRSLNDVNALDALLTQIPQEPLDAVKIAQVETVSSMRRLRAVPELRQMLRDPSLAAARAAVEALKSWSSLFTAENPAMGREVAAEIWQVGISRAAEPGGLEFRAATIEAVGALHSREQARDILNLLNASTDERLRSAALVALGELGDRATSFQIAQWLQAETSPAVRSDALRAFADTSSFEDAADTLFSYTKPSVEPDRTVRERAWQQFERLLSTATNIAVLNRWASDLQDDPERRLPVLRALNGKLEQSGDLQALAESRQNTGETYVKLIKPAEAAAEFRQALDYWQAQRVANPVTVLLVRQLLDAELAARQYTAATDFAARQIAMDGSMQTLLGPDIRDAAQNLVNDGARTNDPQKLRDALILIDDALRMRPPLDKYQDDLRQFQQEAQARLKASGRP